MHSRNFYFASSETSSGTLRDICSVVIEQTYFRPDKNSNRRLLFAHARNIPCPAQVVPSASVFFRHDLFFICEGTLQTSIRRFSIVTKRSRMHPLLTNSQWRKIQRAKKQWKPATAKAQESRWRLYDVFYHSHSLTNLIFSRDCRKSPFASGSWSQRMHIYTNDFTWKLIYDELV